MNSFHHFARQLTWLLLVALTLEHVPTQAQDQDAVDIEEEGLVEIEAEQMLDEFADLAPDGREISNLLFQRLTITKGLILRATKLDEKQQEELNKRDAAWLKNFIQERNKKNGGPNDNAAAGLLGFLGVGQQRAQIVRNQNPAVAAKQFEEDATREVMRILTDEQRQEVDEEFRKQKEFQAKAQAKQILGLLSSRLSLQPAEREALLPKLTEWSKNNELYVEIYTSNQNMIPQLPAKMLRESLSFESRELYKSFQAYNYSPENVWGMRAGNELLIFKELP